MARSTRSSGYASGTTERRVPATSSVWFWHSSSSLTTGSSWGEGSDVVVTVPLHWWGLALPWQAGPTEHTDEHTEDQHREHAGARAAGVARSTPFVLLTLANALTGLAVFAVVINLVPMLVEQGMSRNLAAVALGLGGALGVELLGLDPSFPIKYLVYFLIVVAVGGSGNIKGSLIASLLLGIFDIGGKYYMPQTGAFVIYAVMIVMLIVRPRGLFARN